MKIKEIRVVEIGLNPKPTTTPAHTESVENISIEPPHYALSVIQSKRGTRFLFGMETSRLHYNSRRWDMGFWYLTLRGSRNPNHLRPFCPPSSLAKIVWQPRNCGT